MIESASTLPLIESASTSSREDKGLTRALNFVEHIALVLSDITPTASLLAIGPVVIFLAGTGSIIAYLVGGFIAINVALCMGELGSMFPVAGGLYSIVARVLGRPAGFFAMMDYVGQAIFLPASVALGVGTYAQALDSSLNSSVVAAVLMVIVTAIGVFKININASLTAVFLVLELIVVCCLAAAGVLHPHQSASIIFHPTALVHGHLAPATAGMVIAALAVALFSVNGYDSAINFSEEVKGAAKSVGRAVVIAALIGILFEVVPFTMVVFGAKNLPGFLSSPTPLTDVAKGAFGSTFVTVLTYGAIIAIFNACLAITLQFSRIMWSTGRDNAWPLPISKAMAKTNRFGSPWVATLFVGLLAAGLCFLSNLENVVTFTAVLIIVLYGMIAVAALVSRSTQRQRERPWKMPLWPIPPIITLAGVLIAITKQSHRDLIVTVCIFAASGLYYGLYLRRRPETHWAHTRESDRTAIK